MTGNVPILDRLPTDVVLLILETLHESDVARCACTCHKLYNFAIPVLYRTIHFRLPARFSALDKVIHKLETFTEPDFGYLKWTTQVIVVGSWYHEYTELESDAGIENVLSPAVRMFSTLVDVCLARMGSLQSFIWDAEIPPTQRLVSRLAHHVSLQELQLRLGIDGTPYPLFYPPLHYRQYSQLRTIKLNQINSQEVLETTGRLLSSVRLLKHFFIDADPECNLNFSSAFHNFPRNARLPLITLFAKGFTNFQHAGASFWDIFHPSSLQDLTIESGENITADKVTGFWTSPSTFQHSLKHLSTNLVDHSLIEFVGTCVHLETLVIKSCSSFEPDVNYHDLVNSIRRPVRGLRTVGLYPQGTAEREFLFSLESLRALRAQCPWLKEVAFGLATQDFTTINDIFLIRNLTILHIIPLFLESQHYAPAIVELEPEEDSTIDPHARGHTQSHISKRPTRGNSRGQDVTNQHNRTDRNPQSATPNPHPNSTSSGKVMPARSPMWKLEQWILRHLAAGHAPNLKIVAFNHSYPYEVVHKPLRLVRMQVLVSSVEHSRLFRYPFLEWVEGKR